MRTAAFAAAAVVAVMAAGAGSAVAAPCPPDNNCPPPTVTTLAATSVSDTTATLNGTVNPNGAAATYAFAYGTTTTYGSLSNPPGTLMPATTPQSVTATISGLQPSTTYHFRLTAAATAGPGVGADMTFTTRPRQRKQPRLSLRVRPGRDSALPYKFTSSGALTPPSDVSNADGCSGTVTVQIKSGTKTVSTRRVKVSSSCTYKSAVTFKSRGRLKARGTLKVTARYGGNLFLTTASKSARARYGAA